MGLNIRIPIIIPIRGRGFINQGFGLTPITLQAELWLQAVHLFGEAGACYTQHSRVPGLYPEGLIPKRFPQCGSKFVLI